jgi:hypothetical protein
MPSWDPRARLSARALIAVTLIGRALPTSSLQAPAHGPHGPTDSQTMPRKQFLHRGTWKRSISLDRLRFIGGSRGTNALVEDGVLPHPPKCRKLSTESVLS